MFDIFYVYVPHIVYTQRPIYTILVQLYNNLATKILQDSSNELVLNEIDSKLNLIWKKKTILVLVHSLRWVTWEKINVRVLTKVFKRKQEYEVWISVTEQHADLKFRLANVDQNIPQTLSRLSCTAFAKPSSGS